MKRLASGMVIALAACATASAPTAPVASLAAGSGVTPEALQALAALCSAEAVGPSAGERNLKLTQGVGTGGFKIDTGVAEAQAWFDYGLALSHAFYHEDAKVAMRRAVELDPACAMCRWGLSWALGPTLNYGIDEPKRTEALAAAEAARGLLDANDARGRALVEALVARYQPSQASTEPAFGQAMKAIAERHPEEQELAVLASHALLIPVRAGNEAGLEPALALIERVLKQHPNDTGAIHYYIHATEFAGRAVDAEPYADRLGALAPKAGHLVHMPAHTFFWAGRYHDAAVVNAAAIEADARWMAEGGDAPLPTPAGGVSGYYAHNFAFGAAGALMSGDAELAMKYARHGQAAWAEAADKTLAQRRAYPMSYVYLALARHAPQQMLAIPQPAVAGSQFDAWRYARGEALLATGDAKGALAEARALQKAKGQPAAEVAALVLRGRAAMAAGRPGPAAASFTKAAEIQEAKLTSHRDPPVWWYPVRRSAAAAWLKAGDFARAKAEAEASLKAWPDDALALWVLARAERGLGNAAAADAAETQAKAAWRGSYEAITVEAI
jgi:tetratricopeptide (TPR) repeat protein